MSNDDYTRHQWLTAVIKSPQRTMRWVRVCTFVAREADLARSNREREELAEYVREEMAKAQGEGYDDTATYLQHVLDDLEAAP